MEAYKLEA